jgi:peptidoglycan/LPS O-acetylase OafA/YrhL
MKPPGQASPAVARDSAYRGDIDGLRAIAVAGVLLFHFGAGVPGGFAGVDVFFVISGYLISRSVIAQVQSGRFTVARFLERRVRRIFPACAVTVLGCLIAGGMLLQPTELTSLAKSAIAQVALVANFHFAREVGYFEPAADIQPLLHTWSLAVEEQFYLVFPMVLARCAAGSTARARAMIVSAAAASIMIAIMMSFRWPAPGFYWPFGRAWELLAGALIALPRQARIRSPFTRGVATLAGLGAISVAYLTPPGSPTECIVTTATACAGAMLVIEFGGRDTPSLGTRLLSMPATRALGIISYSVYLVHWPIVAFLRSCAGHGLPAGWAVAGIAASIVMGASMWVLVERPFRHHFGAGSLRSTFWMMAVGSSAIVLSAAWILGSGGLPGRAIVVAAGPEAPQVPRELATESTEAVRAGRLPRMGECSDGRPSFALWGDSHALAVSRTIDAAARARGLCGLGVMRPATAPLLGTWRIRPGEEQRAWNDAAWSAIEGVGVRHVILVARWSVNIDGRPEGPMDTLLTDDAGVAPTPETARASAARGLARTLGAIRSAGMEAWICLEPPRMELSRSQRAVQRLYFGADAGTQVDLERHARLQRSVRSLIATVEHREGIHVIDLAAPCAGRATIADWNDMDHLSPEGAERILRPTFDRMMDAIANGPR